MVIKSRFQLSVPKSSIQQWIFGSPSAALPEEKAYLDADAPDSRFLTYAELRLLAKRIALGLSRYGLHPGDRVLLFSGNHLYYPAIMIGVWMAGGIFTGANFNYTSRELAHQLHDSEASVVIADATRLKVALEAAERVGLSSDCIFAFDGVLAAHEAPLGTGHGDGGSGCAHWTELLAEARDSQHFEWLEPEHPEHTVCSLNYSSGTTGLPKGVKITHYNYVCNASGVIHMSQLDPEYEKKRSTAATLCFIPMYHAYSQGYFLCSVLRERIPIYIMSTFHFVKMLSHIEKFQITRLMAVPPILNVMAKHPLSRQKDLSSLTVLGSGAAPLPVSTQEALTKLVAHHNQSAMVRQGWGMTELTCTALAWDIRREEVDGVGELMPDCAAKLMSMETGGEEITVADSPGELWIHSPSAMPGYWRNPQATAETILVDDDGVRWLRTGDVAFVKDYADGAIFHVVDRVKELIKVKGFQVAPAELEALLLEHRDVVDAAVIGVPNGTEEVPRAYVVKAAKSTGVSAEEIGEWVSSQVVYYKRLRGGIVFVDAIPKNPSGKILRKTLRERAKQESAAMAARL